MEKINANLLNDTLNLVQLARETARLKGSRSQAERLEPVVQKLQTIVANENSPKPTASNGVLGQGDFQTLLSAVQNKSPLPQNNGIEDRNRMVNAMATGGMNDVDVARQLGMTRDEVRMVLNLANVGKRR
jgi:transcriptional regulator with GAF, ATPase, and Fis domain